MTRHCTPYHMWTMGEIQKVVDMLKDGATTKEIAAKMGLREKQVTGAVRNYGLREQVRRLE